MSTLFLTVLTARLSYLSTLPGILGAFNDARAVSGTLTIPDRSAEGWRALRRLRHASGHVSAQ